MSYDLVCTNCGHIGKSKRVTKGHFALELVLWLCFLVPGFIYSIWRLTSRYDACPRCGAANMVPQDSPRGQQLVNQFGSVNQFASVNKNTNKVTAEHVAPYKADEAIRRNAILITAVLVAVVGLLVLFRSCGSSTPQPMAKTEQSPAPPIEQSRRSPPESFRGIKWDSALPSVGKLRATIFKSCAVIVEQKNFTDSPPCSHMHVDTDDQEMFFQRQNVPPIFGVPVSEEMLTWSERKFWSGEVFFYNYKESDVAKIRAALVEQYGKPTFEAPPRLTKWKWPDKNLEISLHSNPVAKRSIGSNEAPGTSASLSFGQTEH